MKQDSGSSSLCSLIILSHISDFNNASLFIAKGGEGRYGDFLPFWVAIKIGFGQLDRKIGFGQLDHKTGFGQLDHKIGFEYLDRQTSLGQINHKIGFEQLEHKTGSGQLDHKIGFGQLDHKTDFGQLDHKIGFGKLDHKIDLGQLDQLPDTLIGFIPWFCLCLHGSCWFFLWSWFWVACLLPSLSLDWLQVTYHRRVCFSIACTSLETTFGQIVYLIVLM